MKPSRPSLAMLGLLVGAAAPLTADAGCPYMTASIGGPSSISRLDPIQTYTASTVGGTPTPPPTYTWTVRTYNVALRMWTFPSTFPGGASVTVGPRGASCGVSSFQVSVRVVDACGVAATATKTVPVFDWVPC
ncbi:hypothetical protein ACLESD_09765 [Pyxidicoccus sp. 3LFB2]